MQFLRKQLDKYAPLFEKGGKFERLYPVFEAHDTILFTPGIVTKAASHVRDALDQKRMMITVVVALLPCFLMAMFNTGYQANSAIAAERTKTSAIARRCVKPQRTNKTRGAGKLRSATNRPKGISARPEMTKSAPISAD